MRRIRIAGVVLAAWLAAESAQALPTSGRVAYWMAENSGADSWGYWDMQGQNGLAYAPGVDGLAFSFDGVDDYVTLGPVSVSPFRQDLGITYSFWANIPVGGGGYVIGAPTDGLGQGYGGVAYNLVDGVVGLDWSPTAPVGDASHGATFSFTPGSWHHVVVAADFANDSLSLYLDGTPLVVDITTPSVTDYTPDSQHTPAPGEDTVGARLFDGVVTAPFEGLLDEVMLYERALTPLEVSQIYTEQTPVPEPSTGVLLGLGLVVTAGLRSGRRVRQL